MEDRRSLGNRMLVTAPLVWLHDFDDASRNSNGAIHGGVKGSSTRIQIFLPPECGWSS